MEPLQKGFKMNSNLIEKDPLLKVENISLKFTEKKVLQNVSFNVNQGELIGIIGTNGAGKTTLLKIILGFLKPTEGNVIFLGKKSSKHIGYVPQKLEFDKMIPLRGRDLVSLGLDGHHYGFPLPNKKRKQLVDEMLESVNAINYADTPIGLLSGGEQQRILIAQALITEPKILILDEPLSNLDIKNSYEIVKLVADISREKGVAVLFVSHDMNPLLDVIDKVLYLADGNAVMGKTQDVFQDDVLTKLYGFPVEVLHMNGRMFIIGNQSEPIVGHHGN